MHNLPEVHFHLLALAAHDGLTLYHQRARGRMALAANITGLDTGVDVCREIKIPLRVSEQISVDHGWPPSSAYITQKVCFGCDTLQKQAVMALAVWPHSETTYISALSVMPA